MQLRAFDRRRGRGFTLLEVLVALIVLSIGLLGLSGLQTLGLRNNYSAFQRTQAALIAGDIIDRMRANRDAAVAGEYDTDFGDAAPGAGACFNNCNGGNVADLDLIDFRAALSRISGDGKIDVQPVAAGGITFNVAEVSVCWGDDRGTDLDCANDAGQILVTRSQL